MCNKLEYWRMRLEHGGMNVSDAMGFAIPESGLKEFIDLYHSKYGIALEEKEAQQRFSDLLMLFSILLRED